MKHSRSFRAFSVLLAAVLALSSFSSAAFAGNFTFVSMADARGDFNGINKPILDKLVAGAISAAPELVIFQGDIVSGNKNIEVQRKQIENFVSTMKPLSDRCKIYYTFGNHECQSRAHEDMLRKTFDNPVGLGGKYEEIAYSFDHEGSHFISLATNLSDEKNIISNDQLKWLEGDLKMSINADHVFVFGHSPAFPVGQHIGSALDVNKGQRDKFWALLNKYRVDAYFCGHEHLYDRGRENNVFQIINGSCGAPLYSKRDRAGGEDFSGSFFHYVKVEVAGPDVNFTTIDDKGQVRDKFTLTRKIMHGMHEQQ